MPSEDYPDLRIKEETKKKLVRFLSDEISRSINDRKVFEKKWKEILDLYDKDVIEEKQDYPFEGAAKLMLPVIATYTETMYARGHNTIWGLQDPFTAKPMRKEFTEHVRPLRNFMTWAVAEELELESKSQGLFSEMFQLGTCISKTIYNREDYSYQEWDPTQEKYVERIATWKDSPDVIPVAIMDFFFPMEARDESEMYWKSHRTRLTWSELRTRERAGKFKDVDRIKNKADQPDDMERDRLNRLELSTSVNKGIDRYDIHEIWFQYDIDDDGIDEKLVAFFHLDSQTLLRIQPNWYPYQLDPFDICQCVYKKYSIYGYGVGHMALPFQKEISAMHNQRLDQGTLANSTMFKRKANARFSQPLKVRPGGEAVVDEMDDLDTMQIGRNFSTGIQEEQHTISFLEQRLGWQEYQMASMMDAQTATTTITAMQEKMRRFDMIIRNMRRFLASIMMKSMLLYQKYYPNGKAFMLMGEDGLYVEDLLHMQDLNFMDGIGIQTSATTSTTSRELERQAKLSIFNLLSQYYVQVEQRFIAAQNPQIPPPVKQVLMAIVMGLSEFVLEILEDFDIRIADRLIVNFQALRDAALEQASTLPMQGDAAFGGMGPVQGTAPNGNGNNTTSSPQAANGAGVPSSSSSY